MTEAATSDASATPNNMPGASPDAEVPTTTEQKPVSTESVLTADERAELDRLRGVHKDEQKYRREATDNFRDAEAYRNMLKALGVEDSKAAKEFDAQAAVKDLTDKIESERVARIREAVARTEGVEPDDFTGTTEEEMRASAQRFKARIDAEVEKRAKAVAPSAAPAAEVTSSQKVDGPQQITSREELKKMSPKEIIAAQSEGRLDGLLGKA